MKTTMKFLLFGMMAMAITITSCEKDGIEGPIGPQGLQGEQGIAGPEGPAGQDGAAQGVPGPKGDAGATGPAGADGADGVNGTNGTNGQNGEDGNANVRSFIYDLTSFSGDSHSQRIPELTQEVLENDVVLGYLKKSVQYYPIPTTNLGIGATGEDLDVQIELVPGSYTMEFFSSDTNQSWPIDSGTLASLKVVIIKSSSITTGKSAKIDVLSKLKSDGIDVRDYAQVMDYFGLDH